MMRKLKPAITFPISVACAAGIGVLLLIMILPRRGEASQNKQPKQNNWFVSGSTGIALRSPELAGAFSFTEDGFRHQPGFAFDLNFGRTLGNRWASAVRWEAYTLFGQSSMPHYTSAGYYAAYPNLLKQEPLEYITQGNTFSFILRFLLSNRAQNGKKYAGVRPFLEAGLGINNYVTEIRYSKIPAAESAALIFRDRNGENANGAGQLTTGLGLKIGTPGEWNAEILINAGWVHFSPLNPVSQLTYSPGNSSRAIVSRITAGLNIPIKRTVKRDRYMPFRW